MKGKNEKDQEIEKKLNELVGQVKSTGNSSKNQGGRLLSTFNRVRKVHLLNKTTDSVIEKLDYLRIALKYLMFDLEATRRENALLKNEKEQLKRENIDLKNLLQGGK